MTRRGWFASLLALPVAAASVNVRPPITINLRTPVGPEAGSILKQALRAYEQLRPRP